MCLNFFISEGPYLYSEFLLDSYLLNVKRCHLGKSLQQTVIPGSPMARRTKHEIKSAQKLARYFIKFIHSV